MSVCAFVLPCSGCDVVAAAAIAARRIEYWAD